MKTGLVDRKRSQIQRLLRRLEKVNGGAFIFKLALLGLIPVFFLYADDVKPVEVPGSGAEALDANGTIAPTDDNGKIAFTDDNGTIAFTDDNGTNTSIVPKVREIPATLGAFSVIPQKDPFRLIKPKPPEPEPTIITPPSRAGIPVLAGISTLGGANRALLRVSPPRGGPAEYIFLEEGVGSQAYGWLKVIKIDVEKGQAEVLVNEETFDLELDAKRDSSLNSIRDANATSKLRPTGKNYTFVQPEKGASYQIRGSSSSGRGSSSSGRGSSSSGRESSSSGRESSGSGGRGLQPVPGRNRSSTKQSLEFLKPFGAEMYEKPAFDLRIQQFITDPAQLSTQREIIRGQYSQEVPTDLLVEER